MFKARPVRIVALDMGPDYCRYIQQQLEARGIECNLTKIAPFCLLEPAHLAHVEPTRKLLQRQTNELVIFSPFTSELFLEEPDFTIAFSGYRSLYQPEHLKIIPYVWKKNQVMDFSGVPGLLWNQKPDLSIGFLGRFYEDRKVVRYTRFLPHFLKKYLLQGKHLPYVYRGKFSQRSLLVWMPCYIRLEVMQRLHQTHLPGAIINHTYCGSQQEDENYQTHMLNHTYSLCVRGFENFSFRFYEALSYGRVPVLIDTDTVLPPNIDWDELCVRVPIHKLHKIEDIIREDYETKSTQDFLERQQKALQMMNTLGQLHWLDELIEEIVQAATKAPTSSLPYQMSGLPT